MKSITIIIPTYNEDPAIINALVKQLSSHNINHIIVDDASLYPVEVEPGAYTKIIRRGKNKGYGAAIKLAVRSCRTKYVGIIDADGQYDVMDLIDMWQSLDDEDMVIGKRISHQGGWKRFWGRLAIRLIASVATGCYVKDINSGVRIFKRHLAKCYASLLCDEFSFSTSITMCMLLDGYKVRWVDANFYPRQDSFSTMNELYHGLITLFQIVKITAGLRTRKLRARLRG